MTKIGLFLRGVFNCRFFSSRFSWLFKDFQDSTPKSHFPVEVGFSLAKQCIFMVWFPNSWFYLSRRKCIIAMFSCFKTKRPKKKITTRARGLFISVLSHVKLITETRVLICHKNMKSMGFFFLQFFDSFCGKFYKKISYRKWIMDGVWDSNNRPFYSCGLSTLAFEWMWGWGWPCFDTNLLCFVMEIVLEKYKLA